MTLYEIENYRTALSAVGVVRSISWLCRLVECEGVEEGRKDESERGGGGRFKVVTRTHAAGIRDYVLVVEQGCYPPLNCQSRARFRLRTTADLG